jgi:hypothetical protein
MRLELERLSWAEIGFAAGEPGLTSGHSQEKFPNVADIRINTMHFPRAKKRKDIVVSTLHLLLPVFASILASNRGHSHDYLGERKCDSGEMLKTET